MKIIMYSSGVAMLSLILSPMLWARCVGVRERESESESESRSKSRERACVRVRVRERERDRERAREHAPGCGCDMGVFFTCGRSVFRCLFHI